MQPDLLTRRRLLWLAPATPVLLGAVGGCAGLATPPVITLGEAELNTLVARAFPLQRRVMEVLDIEATAPQLRLLPERNRLAVVLGLAVTDRLSLRQQRGRLAFDSALRYEPSDQSVRLVQVAVQQVSLGGPPAGAAAPATAAASANGPVTDPANGLAQRLGRPLAERLLENLTVWRLGAERQAQLKAAGLAPGAVTVTARGVEITLARLPG